LPTQALAFLAVFVYATHATQAIAFEWKPGLTVVQFRVYSSPDKVEQTEYALNISVAILSRYEELFGLPYPLPKLGIYVANILSSLLRPTQVTSTDFTCLTMIVILSYKSNTYR